MTYRLFSFFSLLFAVAGLCAGQVKKTDREEAGLVGRVKTVQLKSADYSGNQIKGEGFMKQDGDLVTYDIDGREVDRKPVSDFGEAMGKMSRTFNANGLLTESVWLDPKGIVIRKNTYKYAEGKLIENLTFDGKGTLVEKTLNSFNSLGLVQTETYYDPEKPVARTEFQHDANGNVIEASFFLTDGKKATAPVGPCLGAHRVTSRYNEKGQITSQSFFEDDGTLKRKFDYVYGEKGLVVASSLESKESVTKFVVKYAFDPQGNWTQRISTGTSLEKGLDVFGHQPTPYVRTTVTSREIRYY